MITATVTGNLGRDSELKSLPSGDSVCEFSVASSRRSKDGETTQWVKCTIFGKRGATLAQYLTKGTKVCAVGELTVREHNGKAYVDMRVSDIDLMGGGQRAGNSTRAAEPESAADDDSSIPF